MSNNAAYSLRPASDADYDLLYRLHVATMRPAVEATWGWDETFQRQFFKERWDPETRRIVVVDGVDVGTITVDESPTTVFLGLLEIHPDRQCRGIGTAIIRDVLDAAHSVGLPVGLHVLKASPRARQLYERLGFVITEERYERYVMVASASKCGT